MIHQLEDLATNRELHQSLLKWLRPRCQQSEFLELYQAATKQYIKLYEDVPWCCVVC
ncbi:hypothetical protein [Kamptonema formosum]|uniref:hypothetical protein n=1 Tax=Kamptonema formosum TaxID=331992 RepID=UPI0012D7E381|nr:hypothetical protein [Kamptonema formosum]